MSVFPKAKFSIVDFSARYSSEESCRELFFRLRFPHGFVCPHCNRSHFHAACCEIDMSMAETDLSEIKENSELINDFGFDYLNIINAVEELEEEFEIEFTNEFVKNLKTVDEIIEFIQSKQYVENSYK